MLISPPFLPPQDNQTEEQWLNNAMSPLVAICGSTRAPEGSFPLGERLLWHNGMHLQAPRAGTAYLPVVAVADGEVIFVSQPTPYDASDTKHAQNYPDSCMAPESGGASSWSDNGCVILKHTTEIGADGDTPTIVVFYSLYMHLRQETGAEQGLGRLKRGDRVYRKDPLGPAGRIYGRPGQIHFEICCHQDELITLVGRAPGFVVPSSNLPPPEADGRTDSIFGSLYFFLPATTPTRSDAPRSPMRAVGGTTLGEILWVRMTYQGGHCTLESFSENRTPIAHADGRLSVIDQWTETPVAAGHPAEQTEYSLYHEADRRHTAVPADLRAQSSPSAWYELLRFGRNLGPDPLPPNVAHWRRIIGPQGALLWADLNAPGVCRFSDADFPPLMGWNGIHDDSSSEDQRCDSLNIKHLIRDPVPRSDPEENENRMSVKELSLRLGNAQVRNALRRVICKFPTEWDRDTIEKRYSFLRDEFEAFKKDEVWQPFAAHARAMSFATLPDDYKNARWRFHIKSLDFAEFCYCPMTTRTPDGASTPSSSSRISGSAAGSAQRNSSSFCRAMPSVPAPTATRKGVISAGLFWKACQPT